MKWILSSSLMIAIVNGHADHQHQGPPPHDGFHRSSLNHPPHPGIPNNSGIDEPYMLPHTHVAYHHVEQACRADVEKLCQETDGTNLMDALFVGHTFVRIGAPTNSHSHLSSTPTLLVESSPEETMDQMDQMVNHAVLMHQSIMDQSDQSDESPTITAHIMMFESSTPNQEDQILDLMMRHVMMMQGAEFAEPPHSVTSETAATTTKDSIEDENEDTSAESAPCEEEDSSELPRLAEHFQKYGKTYVAQQESADPSSSQDQGEVDETKLRVARRLSEVTPADLERVRMRLRLPFTNEETRCLRNAALANALSENCARAIHVFKSTAQSELQWAQEQSAFCDLLWVYIFLVLILLTCIAWRFHQHAPQRLLKRSILRAVYEDSKIKHSIERSLGVPSIGSRPPIPQHPKSCKGKVRAKLVAMLIILGAVVVSPTWVLPICISITMIKIYHILWAVLNHKDNNQAAASDCACCCCGGVSPDSPLLLKANGDVKVADPCCGCCQGTGACCVQCSQCCCCNGGGSPGSKAKESGCCCCSGSSGCCSGSACCGCCCCSSNACCGEGGCCCCGNSQPEKKGGGQKHRIQPEVGIYQGIPVQVV